MSDEMRQSQPLPGPGPQLVRAALPPAGASGEDPGRPPERGPNGQGKKAQERYITTPAVTGGQPVKIGLWGSPGSGKTTYLASLPQALSSTDGSIGQWKIFPKSPASAELLKQWSRRLTQEQLFPPATPPGDVVNLAWRFVGDLAGSRYKPRGPFRRVSATSEFDLDLIDVSGEIFGDKPKVSPDKIGLALDHLSQAKGLIFLFDPITEREKHTAFEYMSSTLVELSLRIENEGRRIGQYLPHYVSVCITKFDHKDVFDPACEAGLVNYGADGMPRVIGKHAEEMFNAMCEGRFWPGNKDSYGGALYVNEKLREYFDPNKIRYYATSAIGYKKVIGWDPQAKSYGFQFDPKDYANVDEENGVQRILGPIKPINVLEPLIELQMQITGRA